MLIIQQLIKTPNAYYNKSDTDSRESVVKLPSNVSLNACILLPIILDVFWQFFIFYRLMIWDHYLASKPMSSNLSASSRTRTSRDFTEVAKSSPSAFLLNMSSNRPGVAISILALRITHNIVFAYFIPDLVLEKSSPYTHPWVLNFSTSSIGLLPPIKRICLKTDTHC